MGSVVFSSSYSMSGHSYRTYNVRVGFSESYDAQSNQTTLRVSSVELQIEGNTVNWGSLPFFGSVRVNGTTLLSMNGGSSVRVSLDGGGYCPVSIPSSASVLVTHEDDGTKTVGFQLVGGFSYAGSSYFGAVYEERPFGAKARSKDVALTARPRASAIAACPAAAETLSAVTLSVSRSAPNFYHRASFLCGGTTLCTSEPFATSLSLTIPRAWFAAYPNDETLDVTVSVQTYADAQCETAVGQSATQRMSVSADALMRPKLRTGWVSLAPYNSGAAANITGYVRGYSMAQAVFDPTKIDMTDAVGATAVSYSLSCQGAVDDESPYRSPVLAAGPAAVVCTVTDSRGRTASESFSPELMDYAPPLITEPAVFRCGALGAADDEGTYLSVAARAVFASLNGQNVCTLSAAVAAAGGSYGDEHALASGTAAVLGPVSADLSYSVRITALDALGNTAVYYETVPTRRWAMKFRPNGSGVAFGKAAETDGRFEVSADWDVKLGRPLPVSSGGTGADNAADARSNLGIVFPSYESPVRYYPQRPVSAAANAELFRITDGAITADTVCLGCVFAEPERVRGAVSWASFAGYIAFTGTATAATTADVTLAEKSN